MYNPKIVSRPWEPDDLLDDLQEMINEEPDMYLNDKRTTLCMAKDFLKSYFKGKSGIYVKTRLKKIPKTCKECHLSTTELYGYDFERVCIVTRKECPVEKKASGNWGYCKPSWCPLVEARCCDDYE